MVDKTPEELALHLAPRIKRAIRDAGKNYDKVAEDLGVSKTAVSKWTSKGQIQIANLWNLARVTNKPMAWFFPGYDEADPSADQDADGLRSVLESGDSDLLESVLLDVLEARRDLASR